MRSIFRRLVNYDDPTSYGSKLRARRARHLLSMIEAIHAAKGRCVILDVGGTVAYWRIVPMDQLRRLGVRVNLLNLKAVPVPDDKSDVFASVAGDACDLSAWRDGSVDLVHSNSVIEHVGAWSAMDQMAREVRRVGRAYYLQTPYFWFPIEPHYFAPFLHWMPMSWRIRIAMRFSLGSWPRARDIAEATRAQQAAVLLDHAQFRHLFPDGKILKERWFGMCKSLIAVRAPAAVDEPAEV